MEGNKTMRSKAENPAWEPYFVFLDALRESGETNMYGAAPYLEDEYDLDHKEASAITVAWMKSFDGATHKA